MTASPANESFQNELWARVISLRKVTTSGVPLCLLDTEHLGRPRKAEGIAAYPLVLKMPST